MPDRDANPTRVLLSAVPLGAAEGAAPDEIMLLPAPLSNVTAVDGRGPWRLSDPGALIARSIGLPRNGGDLPIDVNHATQRLGPMGLESPARGWIKGMLVRDGALLARVRWTDAGRAMVAAGEYRSISPEIIPDESGEILQIVGASLTNDPALLGLATLTTRETPMSDLLAPFAAKLGKPATTPAAELLAAIPDPAAVAQLTALQADVATLLRGLGVKDIGAAKLAIDALRAKGGSVETLTAKVDALTRQAAEDWKAREIEVNKRAVGADRWPGLVELFMRDPAQAKEIVGMYPAMTETHTGKAPPADGGGIVALSAEQKGVAAALGIAEADFLKTLKAEKEAR